MTWNVTALSPNGYDHRSPRAYSEAFLFARCFGKDRAVDQSPEKHPVDDKLAFDGDGLAEVIPSADRAPFPVRARVVLLLAGLSWAAVILVVFLILDRF